MKAATRPVQQVLAVTELKLQPEVRARLEACISTYKDLIVDADLLSEQAAIEQSKIGKLLADHGYDKVKIEDLNLTWVRGSTSTKLHVEKLIAQGVTMAQIEAATVTKPKRDYFQIRGKNQKSTDVSE